MVGSASIICICVNVRHSNMASYLSSDIVFKINVLFNELFELRVPSGKC
jgi:hypothetical protein